jgi:hypothetical protein
MKAPAKFRSIANALRVLAVFVFINGISILLPWTWIDSVVVWGGFGHMPDAVVLHYLLRGAGYFAITFGVLIWVIASDVVRYRPIVITVIAIFLVGAPAFYLIDSIAGLPQWFCLMDFTICLLGGGFPLVFYLWPSSHEPID